MFKKIIFICLTIVMMSFPAMGIELPNGATIPWANSNTAYTSTEFNDVLGAYGLELSPEAVRIVPSSYAKLDGNKVIFNHLAYAYEPFSYHAILTAYGLVIDPELVAAKMGLMSYYAKIKDGNVVFGKVSTIYNPYEWEEILSVYHLPVMTTAAVVMPGDGDGDGVTDDIDLCPNTPKGISVGEYGCWFEVAKIQFDFDKSDIKKEYESFLYDLKRVFDAYPDMNILITGYTCDIGTEEYNDELSLRRAKAIRDYLVYKVGIDPSRLSVFGGGELNPTYPNDIEENRMKNRKALFSPIN